MVAAGAVVTTSIPTTGTVTADPPARKGLSGLAIYAIAAAAIVVIGGGVILATRKKK